MKGVYFLVVIIAGVLLGMILIAILPETGPTGARRNPEILMRLHRIPRIVTGHPEPASAPKPAVTQYTPWILIGLGLGVAVAFRKETSLVGLGSAVVTAGLTALLGTH